MSSTNFDWNTAFIAIEVAMRAAAAKRSAAMAGSEAERYGLTRHGDMNATYQDKVWERTVDGLTLRLKWHATTNPTHTERTVLSLEFGEATRSSDEQKLTLKIEACCY
jgi:hypothetical protein